MFVVNKNRSFPHVNKRQKLHAENMGKFLWILQSLAILSPCWSAPAHDRLFANVGVTHVLITSAHVSTCSLLPAATCAGWGLNFILHAHLIADDTLLLHISNMEVSLSTGGIGPATPASPHHRPPDEALSLATPWQAKFTPTGALEELHLPADEPPWSGNIKKALSVSLQLQAVGKTLPGAYSVREPCLHGDCIVEYSSADGITIRKSHGTPTTTLGVGRRVWSSATPDLCSKFVKQPIIGDTERWYTLDERGIVNMRMRSTLQVHTDSQILETSTNMTFDRVDVRRLDNPLPTVELPVVSSAIFKLPSFIDPTLGRIPVKQDAICRSVIQILLQMAESLDAPGIAKNPEKLHNKLLLELQEKLSRLTVNSLNALMSEVEVGTSYKQETVLNLLLEVLPQVKSKNSAIFVKDLIVSQRVKDENSLLQLIRKLPFNIAEYSTELLKELEPLMRLTHATLSSAVRHSGILSFATLVFKTYINGACTPDTFEEYVQLYFSRYAESTDYSNRMAWLQGLSNLEMERVTSYLAPVIAGTSSAVTSAPTIQHERFLAVWATMALAPLFPVEVNRLYWPILTDTQENLEMRVAAVTMLLLGEPTPRRMLALHWYIAADKDPHLKHFWHTTIKSLQRSTYPCYKPLVSLASYIASVSRPPVELRYWSTGNYLVDLWDGRRDSGMALQTLLFAQPGSGLPAAMYVTFQVHASGLVATQYALYLKMIGVSNNFLNKLSKMNAQSVKIDELSALLKEMKVEPREHEKVHIEVILKYQYKTIYTLYVNQTTFDKWTSGDVMQTLNAFIQAESHVNQQFVTFPLQVEVALPTELGTPVTLSTTLSSITSLRGNLTHSMEGGEVARQNDVHLRYSSLGVISARSYNPILNTKHAAEVSQASATYLPLNLRVAVDLNEKLFRLRWTSPAKDSSPGLAAHARTQVSIETPDEVHLTEFCSDCKQVIVIKGKFSDDNIKNNLLFDCEAPPTLPTIVGQLLDSHQANFNIFPALRPVLAAIHTLLLAGAPGVGRCGAALLPSQDTPLRTDLQLSLADINTRETSVRIVYGLVVRKNVENGEEYINQKGSTLLELSENKFKASLKASGHGQTEPKQWKMCVELEQKYLGGPEQELGRHPGPFELDLMTALGPAGDKTCPSNGTMLKLRVLGQVNVSLATNDIVRSYDVSFYGKNLPESVSKVALRAAGILGLADDTPWAGVAGAGLAGRIAKRLTENPATVDGTIEVDETTSRISLKGDPEPVIVEGESGLAWLLDSRSEFQILRDIGVYRECRLGSGSIQTLDGAVNGLNETSDCFGLALADCSDSPKFALLHVKRGDSLEIRLYTGGNYASIAPGSPLLVGVNGKTVDWKNGYRFPEGEAFHDFEIWGTENSVRVDSVINGAVLSWTNAEVTILLPNTYASTLCGECVGPEQIYRKC